MEEEKVIDLKRHEWPDEKEARIKMEKNVRKRKLLGTIARLVMFFIGICVGITATFFYYQKSIPLTDENTKINSIKNIMENKWFFASEVQDIDNQLTNMAIDGMTTFEDIDKHTMYFSKEDLDSFHESINMNYVGIGVTFSPIGEKFIVNQVFHDGPADQAGIKEGDILYKADEELLNGKTSDELKDLVLGDEGSIVKITVLRDGKEVNFDISRAEINHTTYGYMIDEDTGYLDIYSFGESTYDEAKSYLNEFTNLNMDNLIIDLRDDGGGWLNALVSISGLFLPSGTIAMNQVYPDGSNTVIKANGQYFDNINGIVILINENTASAAEVLTMALKENRDDVTIVGDVSYGKGTVQVTQEFSDGSALKYTSSKWTSPEGVWVNKVGITPDIEVSLADILTSYALDYNGEIIVVDTVSAYVKTMQLSLDFLGYEVDRSDGYFSQATSDTLKAYQAANNLETTGNLDDYTYESLLANIRQAISSDKISYDDQVKTALGVLNGEWI